MKPQTSRSKINKKVQEEPTLATGDTEASPQGIELHDDGPKRVMAHHAVVDETNGQGVSPRALT
jgi:hypothetical protein